MRHGAEHNRPIKTGLCAFLLTILCLLGPVATAVATEAGPKEQLKSAIDRVLAILQDPALKGEARAAERRAAIRRVADEIFDFEEIARRSLAQHWRALTPDQRKVFVQLFSDVLERAYISKIELYSGEPIQYTGERVSDDLATVTTKMITKKGTEVPIDYRLHRRDSRWLVYDVIIEGVSLVSNYRTQFNTIIQTASYAELVKKLRSRAEALHAPN